MDRKKEKDKKEEEKREKKEREKREKEEREREKKNKSPRPVQPVISGPILPPSMLTPLPPSGKGSTRASPPSDPAPVNSGSASKIQQLLGAEVPTATPIGNTGSVSKMQQLLGEVPPGVVPAPLPARTAPTAGAIPKPIDSGSTRLPNKETVLPPPPLLKCVLFNRSFILVTQLKC